MATKVTTKEGPKKVRKEGTGRPKKKYQKPVPSVKFGSRFPWEEWFSRLPITLKKGVHYFNRTESMKLLIRIASARPQFNLDVTVTENEEGDEIHVSKRDMTKPQKGPKKRRK